MIQSAEERKNASYHHFFSLVQSCEEKRKHFDELVFILFFLKVKTP